MTIMLIRQSELFVYWWQCDQGRFDIAVIIPALLAPFISEIKKEWTQSLFRQVEILKMELLSDITAQLAFL